MKLLLFLVALTGVAFYFKDDIFKALDGVTSGAGAGASGPPTRDGSVWELNAGNFDDFVDGGEATLVKFVAAWCGHCKALKQPYADAAAELEAQLPNVRLATVDAVANKDLAARFGVRGFPTIKFYRGSVASGSDYSGGRTKDAIVNWIKKKTGPPAVALESAEAVEAFKAANEVGVVGYFTGGDGDSEEKEAFLAAATEDDEVSYGIVTDADVAKAAGAGSSASVVLYKQFDEKLNEFDGTAAGGWTKGSIASFVSVNGVPLVMPFNEKYQGKIFGSKIEGKALLFADSEADGFGDILSSYRDVAEANRGELVFSTVDKDKKQVLDFFSLTPADLPVFFVLKVAGDGMVKYKNDGDLSSIGDFVAKYRAGEVSPWYKSQPAPDKMTDEDGLTTAVGSTFKDLFTEDKDVLVEFYAPWCGHCKKLAPIYKELAQKLKGVDSITIAQFDASSNDAHGVEVRGFPTIKFWPAGAKSPVDYNGDRTVEGFTSWLKKNVKHQFTLSSGDDASSDDDDDDKEDL